MPAKAHHQHNTRARRPSDDSFLHSLASIRRESSHKMMPSHSRRHSTDGDCKSGTRVCGASSRRATVGDPAQMIHPTYEDRPCWRPPPYEVQNVLKTHRDAKDYRPSHRRDQCTSPTSVTSSTNSYTIKVTAPHLPFGTCKPSSAKKKDVPSEIFQGNPPIKNLPRKQVYCSRRDDYTLGETARSSSHMMSENCPQSVYQLKNYDFAFVKRSNGSWTYAILAHRSQGSSCEDEIMMFVTDEKGCTKVIAESDWASFIRCLAESEDQSQ